MISKSLKFGSSPGDIIHEKWDCIWVSLSPRKTPSPLRSVALQWLDWRMHGALSRHIVNGTQNLPSTTFIPTINRIAAPLIAIESTGAGAWNLFAKNCEGLKIKELLLFSEDGTAHSDLKDRLEKTMHSKSAGHYPEHLIFGSDL
jgi:hypothetical protein